MESVDLVAEEEEDVSGTGFVKPHPIPPPNNDAPKRSNNPSVSIEQAAKPTFDISVGDPHKVGDLTGSHTVYQVFTKVFLMFRLTRNVHTDRRRRHQKHIAIPK